MSQLRPSSPRNSQKEISLSAIQPSNRLTLGNYLGAIKNWLSFQEDYQCYFFMVDLHAITVRQDPKILREQSYQGIATCIAAGVDPETACVFIQSHVPEHAELAWVLNCFTYMGELNRMTQFKDKSATAGKNIAVGLYGYPVLMAADILLYDTEAVPVGADQKQHVELTRDIAMRLNNLYGDDTVIVPKPFIPQAGAKIMSLQEPTKKMSKSDPNDKASVFLIDSDKTIEKKIKRAVTDSDNSIRFSDDKPGVKNLLEIQRTLTGKSIETLVNGYEGKMYGQLKGDTAELVIAAIGPIRDETARLMTDKTELDRLLKKNALRAREHASKTLSRIYERIGFVRP